ncbi:MAG TPA: metal-dependent hydrolase [Acidimicrobiales bacterium]|nr:metal-dependent hydrolase [Acidimicrobiales bacterium]
MTDIPVRRMNFDDAIKTVPKHFAKDDDIVASHIAVALSSVFPDGEDFFVRSVRHYRDEITDPELKRQVAGFIGQESIHGREHRVLNERFAELGYPTKVVERLTKKGLELRTRFAPASVNLATTAALEHFTATLAELILSDPEARGLFGDETVKNLFLWHALEESEHKAVAFDVYKQVAGGERMRTITMNVLRFGFPVAIAGQVVVSLLLDKDARRHPRRVWQSLKRVRHSPLMSKKLWNQLKDYNRRDFHPNQSEHTGLVEPWREELFGANGTLNDKLATSAVA